MSRNNTESETDAWVEIVRQKVAAMRFGSVQIIVHEGRVTQVESTEKTRLSGDVTVLPVRK
ncbi:MAG TPA: YezD family protein [Prosthecobacter sp.]